MVVMDCKEFKKLISLYLDGRFSEIEELDAFENHFASCDSCWEEYAGLYKIHRMIQKRRSEIVAGSPEIKKMVDTLRNLTKKGLKGDKLVEAFEKETKAVSRKTKVLVNGKEADYEVIGNKIRLVLFREPRIEEKDIKILINDQNYFDERFSSSEDYLFDVAADTGSEAVIKDLSLLSEDVSMDGIGYKIEFDPAKKVSILTIDLPKSQE
jgi:hypothetical protein